VKFADVDIATLDGQARAIWGLVERDTGDPRLRGVLATLYRRAALPARDLPALAAAVQGLVQTHIKYLREYPETYASPLRTLKWGVGDCDDQAAVVCALLRSARVPCRLVFCGRDDGTGPLEPQHVFAEAEIRPGEWCALETVKRVPPGWSAVDHWRSTGKRAGRWSYGDRAGTVGEPAVAAR